MHAMYLSSGKLRTVFSDEQKSVLRQSFAKQAYPSEDTLKSLSKVVGLSEQVIHTWFRNERERKRGKRTERSTKGTYKYTCN